MEEKRTPQLRFPEFQGEWEEKKLEDLSSKIGDGIHSTPVYDDYGEYFFINGNNLVDGKVVFNETTKKVSEEEFTNHKNNLEELTLLLSINGTIGNIAFYNNEKVLLGKSAAYINFQDKTLQKFLYHLLQTHNVKRFFNSELTGTTIRNLSLKTIRSTKLLIPSLPEQEKIATFLTTVDKRIGLLTEKKAQLEQYKKGVMQQLFSQQIRFTQANGTPYPDWEEKKLGKVFSIFNGYAFSSADSSDNGVRWIKIADVGIDMINDENKSFLPTEFSEKHKKFLLNEGDYVVALTRPYLNHKLKIARISKAELPALLNQRVGKIETNNNLEFIYQLLHHNELSYKIENNIAGTDPPNLSPNEIKNLKLLIPSLPEQQKIAAFLSAIDARIATVQQQIIQTQTWKQGLLQGMFV